MTAATIQDFGPAAMRQAMVTSQLRANAVSDLRVVAAMATMPREDFLPSDVAGLAYRDTAIPLGRGRWANPPMATGRLLTRADLRASDRVLLIGAAGGYTAALLAGIVESVVAVEVDAELAGAAAAALSLYPTVRVEIAPLAAGSAADAPYDVLIIDGAVDAIPAALLDQLRTGAKVVTGLNDRGVTRLAAGVKTAGGFGLTSFADAECVILPGFAAPASFRF